MSIKRRETLLDAVGAAVNSDWLYIGDTERVSVHVFGMGGGDVVRIQGSNEGKTPANPVQLGADITADGIYKVSGVVGSIRVDYAVDTGGGTITAIVVAE
jgi:hypothetical protein